MRLRRHTRSIRRTACRTDGCERPIEDEREAPSDSEKREPIGPRLVFDHLDEIANFVGRPRLGVVVDFDGTLSEFAPTPGEATINPACARALSSLALKLTRLMVLSGRGVHDLAERVSIQGLCYGGNHGAEYLCDGVHRVIPGAEVGKDHVAAVLSYLKQQVSDPALVWEDKVFSASVHYRRVRRPADAERALRSALATAPRVDDLDVFWGNSVLEIRPKTGLNKGHAIYRLIDDGSVDSVLFIGDDTTDIDGMRALRELRDSRRADTLGVVVAHPKTPEALTELADYRLGSVAEVGRFLGWVDGLRDE